MQRENEVSRGAVDGKRTDDDTRCTLVVVHERTGHWAVYPHGADKLGVRVAGADAIKVVQAILAGAP